MKVTGKFAHNLKNYVKDANWIIQNGTEEKAIVIGEGMYCVKPAAPVGAQWYQK